MSRQRMGQVSALQVEMGVRLEDDGDWFVLIFDGSMELPDKAHGTFQISTVWVGGEAEVLMLGRESYMASLGDRSFEPLGPEFLLGDYLGLLRHLRAPVAADAFSNLEREQDVTLSEFQTTFIFDPESEQELKLSETPFYQITFLMSMPEFIDLVERYPGVKGLSGKLLIHQDSLLPHRLRLDCEGCPPIQDSGVDPVLEYVLTGFDEPVVIPSAQDPPNADDHGDAASGATSLLVGQEMDGTIGLTDDVDFFSFQAEAGRMYAITVGSSRQEWFGVQPTLYDTDGHSELASYVRPHRLVGPSSGARQLVWEAPSTGTYYVAVDGKQDPNTGVGRYIITVTTAGSTPDAAPLILGQELAGMIAFLGNVDFFSFQAEGGRTYAINVGVPGRLESVVTLYDTDGISELASDAYYKHPPLPEDQTPGSRIVWESASTGTYFVAVGGSGGDVMGYYTITVTEEVPVEPEVKESTANDQTKSKESAYNAEKARIQAAVDAFYSARANSRFLGRRQYPIIGRAQTSQSSLTNQTVTITDIVDDQAPFGSVLVSGGATTALWNPLGGTQGAATTPPWADTNGDGVRNVGATTTGDDWTTINVVRENVTYYTDPRYYFIDFAVLKSDGWLDDVPRSASADHIPSAGAGANTYSGSYIWYVDKDGFVRSLDANSPSTRGYVSGQFP